MTSLEESIKEVMCTKCIARYGKELDECDEEKMVMCIESLVNYLFSS